MGGESSGKEGSPRELMPRQLEVSFPKGVLQVIKRQDISAFVRELRPKEGPVTDETLNKSVRELLDRFATNYDQIDEEAKAHVDWSLNALFQLAGQDFLSDPTLRRPESSGVFKRLDWANTFIWSLSYGNWKRPRPT